MPTDKRKRFEKVAENRADKVIDGLRLLSNCSNKNNYAYSKEDVDYMFDEIKKALREAQNRFENELGKSDHKKFKFKK